MLTVIVNEQSGNGAGGKALAGIRAILEERKIPHRICVTSGPAAATAIADEAVGRGENEIVCIGGDGTIFEVVNGIAGRFARLYFVPCGTGNDFVRTLKLPKDPLQAFRAQLDGEPRRIDTGRLNEYYFLNVSGSGFDVEVLRQAARFKKLGKGLLPYLLGIFAALRKFRPLPVEMTLDGRTEKREVTIFSVGNGRYFGGGMKAVPHAEIDDGLFDVVVADRLGRPAILKLLSKFIQGEHTALPQVHELRARELTVRCPGMTVDIDGELIPMDEARYQLLPGALEIMCPK